MAAGPVDNIVGIAPQFAIGTKRSRIANDNWCIVAKIVQVDGSGTFTSDTIPVNPFSKVVGTCLFNENGTLYIDQSPDGTNFDYTTTFATTGATTTAFAVEIVAPFIRVRWANGTANDTTTHRLYVWAKVMT